MGKIRALAHYISAAFLTVYLFTLGAFRESNRVLIRSINAHFGKRALDPPLLLPVVTLSQLTPDTSCLKMLKIDQGEQGNVSVFELYCIIRLVKEYAKRGAFEFGTSNGRTTLNIAANIPDGVPVYTLDLPVAQSKSPDMEAVAALSAKGI